MRLKAYAKINVTLDILKKDRSGYHHMQTILQQIDLHDTLILKKIPKKISAQINDKPKIILSSNEKTLPLNEKNTVYKAAELLHKKYAKKIPFGVHIFIQKQIPIATGLGGGSSDAAVALKALNKLWNLELSFSQLQKLGAKIGMDVPFFIQGKTVYADHFGEKIYPLPPIKKLFGILLDNGQKKNSTADAYRKIDVYKNALYKGKTDQFLQLLKAKKSNINPKKTFSKVQIFELIHNDFDQLYQKKTFRLRQKLMTMGAKTITCTGAGPLLYALFENRQAQEKAYHQLRKQVFRIWKIQS